MLILAKWIRGQHQRSQAATTFPHDGEPGILDLPIVPCVSRSCSRRRTLITATELRMGIAGLARRIETHYSSQQMMIAALLNGSLVFLADLVRELGIPVEYDTLCVSVYRGESQTAGDLRIETGHVTEVRDRHLLLFDDILDTGATLQAVRRLAHDAGGLSVRTAVLLWKRGRTLTGLLPDEQVGLIPNVFVAGSGLDYNGKYRQWPHILELESSNSDPDPRLSS